MIYLPNKYGAGSKLDSDSPNQKQKVKCECTKYHTRKKKQL